MNEEQQQQQAGGPQSGQPQGANPGASSGSQPAGQQPTGAQGQDPQAQQGQQGGDTTTPATPYVPDKSPFATKVTLPPHNLDIEDNYFIKLLAISLSLSVQEKQKIIESIPTLSQYQVDKLVTIFEEEQAKFHELESRMKDQVQKLREKQQADWQILEMEVEKQSKKSEDDQKAEEIRKKLGL